MVQVSGNDNSCVEMATCEKKYTMSMGNFAMSMETASYSTNLILLFVQALLSSNPWYPLNLNIWSNIVSVGSSIV